MRFLRWAVLWLLLPAILIASLGAAVSVRLGYEATQGVGYALIGTGIVLAAAMAAAGDDAVFGYEMRMDGREPRGPRGSRWVEQAWATGVSDPRSLPQHDPSIDRLLLAGLVYAAVGIAVLVLF